MKVILLQDVRNVGRKNEVKEVSPGFARNFLFSKKAAIPATEENLRKLASSKEQKEKSLSRETQKYREMAEKLKSLVLEFKIKVGEKGQAFGSITSAKLTEALRKKGIDIEKEWLPEEHIKSTGEKTVKIEFPYGIIGEVKVRIEAE